MHYQDKNMEQGIQEWQEFSQQLAEKSLDEIERSYGFGKIIARSRIMQELFAETIRIAKSDANVMIYGESGTGKELFAQTIHANSRRKKKPFIPVDCVALPENLLENELFGHEKGAFTGAVSAHRGLLQIADHGSLFLDEICELALNLQAKLLRVLQEYEFRRIGSNKLTTVDLRIISATNKEPNEAVKSGLLRQDLYYRLNVIPLVVPPLRKRQIDIPLLFAYFFKKSRSSNRSAGKTTLDPEVLHAMMNYSWPGNVRELKNLVERLISLVDGSRIRLSDLPQDIRSVLGHPQIQQDRLMKSPFFAAKKEFEKEYFSNLLEIFDGNISKAARFAQIDRKTIYRIIKECNINGKSG